MKRYESNDGSRLNSSHASLRGGLKALGFLLVFVGGIFALVGFVDFFGAFGGRGMPSKFWCLFVGMPMLAGGVTCLKFAFMGKVSRYIAGETAPVVKDTANYMIDGTKDSVVSVVRESLGTVPEAPASDKACAKCGVTNDHDAKFCRECGSGFKVSKICSCGETNDPDAKFCDECGKALV